MDGAADAATPPALERGDTGRFVVIDILRGLAILWVMVFHLYSDMTLHLGDTPGLYSAFRDRLGEGRPIPALTALGELILGQGFFGVGMFMMLSGLSLTMNAYRRGEPSPLSGYRARFRKIVPAYWGGVLILTGTVALMALLQMLVDGGSFREQWWNVRIAEIGLVRVQWDDVLWALSIVGFQFRTKMSTAPVGSLWFVELLLQYYLLFPLLLIALKRVGPWRFAAAAVAFTTLTRWWFIPYSDDHFGVGYMLRYIEAFAPFRVSEFCIGMSLGYLFVHRRAQVNEWVRSPFDIAGILVIGSLLVMGGVLGADKSDGLLAISDPIVSIGLAVCMLPLLFKVPGRLEVSAPARALVFLGVISFAALIVDDQMRYAASFLRYEGVRGPAWWFFLWVVYVPVGTLLAYPLAKVLGLLPKRRDAVAPHAARPAAALAGAGDA